MSKFALKHIPQIKGKVKFYLLITNSECQYEEFEKKIAREGNYESELDQMQSRFQEVAEMIRPINKTKFRDITPKKEEVKEYEAKTKNLRVYLIHQENKGRVIIFAGQKNTQKKDIRKFRSIKSQYLSTLK